MKQVLSQQEIDSLLSALSTGEIDPETIKEEEEKDRVKTYDFRRPIKLSKEYINTLQMIFENFSKIAGNKLSSLVHNNVNVSMGAVEQISYDEFTRSTPNPTLMSIFNSSPMGGTQVLEINPQFCIQVIELMCGGAESTYYKSYGSAEEFTDIEIGILEEVMEGLLDSYEVAWNEIINIKTKQDYLETNPQLLQNLSPNEPVILISFTVEVFENKSFMNICIPYVSLENLTDKLSIKNWFDFEKDYDEMGKEILTQRMMDSNVELEVELGKTILSVDSFLELNTGDVLQLDTESSDPLKMYVEGKLHYMVKPGRFKDNIAVEVLQYLEEDVEQ